LTRCDGCTYRRQSASPPRSRLIPRADVSTSGLQQLPNSHTRTNRVTNSGKTKPRVFSVWESSVATHCELCDKWVLSSPANPFILLFDKRNHGIWKCNYAYRIFQQFPFKMRCPALWWRKSRGYTQGVTIVVHIPQSKRHKSIHAWLNLRALDLDVRPCCV
jgi:hypothetical protein